MGDKYGLGTGELWNGRKRSKSGGSGSVDMLNGVFRAGGCRPTDDDADLLKGGGDLVAGK
jgi:hypothetical protein